MNVDKGSGSDPEASEQEEFPGEDEEWITDLSPAFTVGEIEMRREVTRGVLTIGLFAVFAVTIVVCLLIAAWADASRWETVKDLLQVLLPAETGLLGSASGFYFGTRVRTR